MTCDSAHQYCSLGQGNNNLDAVVFRRTALCLHQTADPQSHTDGAQEASFIAVTKPYAFGSQYSIVRFDRLHNLDKALVNTHTHTQEPNNVEQLWQQSQMINGHPESKGSPRKGGSLCHHLTTAHQDPEEHEVLELPVDDQVIHIHAD